MSCKDKTTFKAGTLQECELGHPVVRFEEKDMIEKKWPLEEPESPESVCLSPSYESEEEPSDLMLSPSKRVQAQKLQNYMTDNYGELEINQEKF